jgi:pimeloyl-ACP methyl ester carboxylesterase
MRRLYPLIMICLLMGLISCNGIGRPFELAYTPIFEETPCPFTLPPGQVEGQTVECGYLLVPEDRADLQSRTIRLAVAIFHPENEVTEPDPIIYLVGGPGASALEMINLTFEQVYAPILATNRDLIIFDQRGVGFSEPALDCIDIQAMGLELLDNEMDGRLLDDDEIKMLFDEAYQACAQALAELTDLSDYNTVASAADVNDLRIALGDEQVNLWGTSYGTRLALGIMRDHPEGIRSVVLDSVYPPDMDLYLETPANLDRSLALLFDSCAADPACNTAYLNLRRVFFDTLAALNKNPVSLVVTNPLDGKNYNMLFSGDAFFGLIFQLLYQTEALPLIPKLIYDASLGELELAGRIYGAFLQLGPLSSRGMMFSVQCNEELYFSTLEQYENSLLGYPDLAPYLQDSIVGNFSYRVCTFWDSGHADAQENEPVTSDIPTLILQGEFDPITPPAWGQHAAETLSNSYYYLYPGVGHGASTTGCAREMMIGFIQDPHQDPDGSCIEDMNGIYFIIPDLHP